MLGTTKKEVDPAVEDVDTIKEAIRTGFLKLDEAMRQMPEVRQLKS